VLDEYSEASQQQFAGHSLAAFIRNDLADEVGKNVGHPDRYVCEGSPGQGNWARIPWVAIFDTLITTSAQSGYYPVLLFKANMTGVYLSLNQGVTEIVQKYKSGAGEALRAHAEDFRQQLGGVPANFPESKIELEVGGAKRLGALYEAGNIFAAFYPRDAIPNDVELKAELRHMLGLYDALSYNETLPVGIGATEADEEGLFTERLGKFRYHKRIERNARLVKAVKKLQGDRCKACNISFLEKYGEIGMGYIEAHHLTPLASLKGDKLSLNPLTDFAVLCANCHAMIHKSIHVDDVAAFIAEHLSNKRSSEINPI